MAALIFDREPSGTPYDRKQELTEWVPVDTVPVVADGQRFPARTFSAGGYLANDSTSLFLGLQGVAVHAIILPDFAAMSGTGRRALIYRGHGGPTAANYWAWGVELERNGTQIEVYAVHQTQAGAFTSQLIGDFAPTGDWIALAVSREVTPDGFEARAWVNSAPIGTVLTVTDTASTQGENVTLGCRVIAAGTTERAFLGSIERVLVQGTAATDAEIRFQYNALIGAYDDAFDKWRQYLPSAIRSGPTDVYGRYRVRPMAEMIGPLDAAVRRFEEAALPPNAYGPQLAYMESALELSPMPTDTIAARQAAAHGALAGTPDLGAATMQELAAILFGVPFGDVEILEGFNYWDIPLTGTGELTGAPWRVRGPVDVTSEVAGMAIGVPVGRDIRYEPLDPRGVFVELGIHHLMLREADHGLAVTIDSAAGIQEETWAGIALVAPDGAVWWLALDPGGVILRNYDLATGISGRTVLDATVTAPVELVAEWTGAAWTARWRDPGTGPGNWTESVLPAPLVPITWMGLSVSSILAATTFAVDVTITAVTAKAGDSPAWAYWQAFDADPPFRSPVAHTTELNRKGRAVSSGTVTYTDVRVAAADDLAGSFAGYTPGRTVGARNPNIGGNSSDAAQSTGIFPSYLWTMQDAAAPVVDVVGGQDLGQQGAAATYEAAGPADRFAVELANSNNRLSNSSILDVGSTVFLAMILRITGNGLILGKEQDAVIGWVLTKNAGNLTLRIGDGVGTATATLTDIASGFVADEWFALTALVKNEGANGRVALATSQASAEAVAALTTTNTGNFALGSGSGGNSASHRQRWVQATHGGEAATMVTANILTAAVLLASATGVS